MYVKMYALKFKLHLEVFTRRYSSFPAALYPFTFEWNILCVKFQMYY
jgi:hypothetical protein